MFALTLHAFKMFFQCHGFQCHDHNELKEQRKQNKTILTSFEIMHKIGHNEAFLFQGAKHQTSV